MAKTETKVSNLKINRGTYEKIQENIASITNDELVILTDKQVPIPQQADSGKGVFVDSTGNYVLQNGLPYITTAPSSDNTNGIIVVVLSSEPATYYNGYLYLIEESQA